MPRGGPRKPLPLAVHLERRKATCRASLERERKRARELRKERDRLRTKVRELEECLEGMRAEYGFAETGTAEGRTSHVDLEDPFGDEDEYDDEGGLPLW